MKKCNLCDSKHYAFGLCEKHYKRSKSKKPSRTMGLSPIQKFKYFNAEKNENGCILWTGYKSSSGYGRINFNGKFQSAHRFAYEINFGEIQNGLCVCHKCDIPLCVNPDHLFLGTIQENTADKVAKKRQFKKLTDVNIFAILNDSRSIKEIALSYGVCTRTIGDIKNGRTRNKIENSGENSKLIEEHIKDRFLKISGERSGTAKLKENQVIAIRGDNRKYEAISAEYKISIGTVHNIKHRKRWAWL